MILKIRKTIPMLVSLIIMLALIAFSSSLRNNTPIKSTVSNKSAAVSSTADETKDYEMRGVWVSYMELSMENESDKSEASFKSKFSAIAQKCKKYGFNTLIVQVRPFCDALYNSKYFPYSHILTGVQGKNPGYDALKIMCEISRQNGLYIHAWVNPYRISTNDTPNKLSNDNPYVKEKSLGLKADSGVYFDPSNEAARNLITDGVVEIVKNYDVDGIQFDDYFYPTQDENFDKKQYEEYVKTCSSNAPMGIYNWRIANVNMLVCETYKAIHEANDEVDFGISPQGNLENNYNLYADVKSWCTCRRFVDYICPQIYFSLDNPALTFENSLNEWSGLEYAENVKLYVGLAGYKAGSEDDSGTWLEQSDILAREYNILKQNDKVKGFMLYSYSSLDDDNAKEEIQNLCNAFR